MALGPHVAGTRRSRPGPQARLGAGESGDEAEAGGLRTLARALAGSAHDFASTLTRATLNLDLLDELAADPAGVDVAALVGVARGLRGAVNSLEGQVSSLRDLAWIEHGIGNGANRRPVDLVSFLQERLEEHRLPAGREHRILLSAAAPVLEGHWDSRLLGRALDNLLSNAAKYSAGDSEILVSVWREAAPDGDWAVIAVRDRGIGIPARDVSHMFDPYRRGRNVGEVPGQGIGLASVKQIVDLHEGRVEVSSRLGRGTTVTVRLPLSPIV